MANLSRTLSAEQKQHLIKVKIFLEQVIIKGLNSKKLGFDEAFEKLWNTEGVEVHSRSVNRVSFGIDHLNVRTKIVLENGIWMLGKTCDIFYITKDVVMKESLDNLAKSKSKHVRVFIEGDGSSALLNITITDCDWPA